MKINFNKLSFLFTISIFMISGARCDSCSGKFFGSVDQVKGKHGI